jgi:formylglycine-generating enzyme required for sulfatase activity
VHLTFDEAQSVCGFFGKRLPTDKEWTQAAYLEDRLVTPKGYVRGQRYEYPSGTSPKGSHCLTGCGLYRGVAPAGSIDRGTGRQREADVATKPKDTRVAYIGFRCVR